MNYQVYTPIHELQPFVKCFWSLDDDEKELIFLKLAGRPL